MSKQHVTQRDDLGCVVINFGSEFDHLYTRVSCSMHSVHTSNGNSSKVREFVHLAQERYVHTYVYIVAYISYNLHVCT